MNRRLVTITFFATRQRVTQITSKYRRRETSRYQTRRRFCSDASSAREPLFRKVNIHFQQGRMSFCHFFYRVIVTLHTTYELLRRRHASFLLFGGSLPCLCRHRIPVPGVEEREKAKKGRGRNGIDRFHLGKRHPCTLLSSIVLWPQGGVRRYAGTARSQTPR